MPLNGSDVKNKWTISMIIILIIIIDLFSLYYLKYKNQGISIREFSLFNTGNILNLISSLILIISLVIYTKTAKGSYSPRMLVFCTVLMTAMLIISEIYSRVRLPLPNIYFVDHPLKDILKGFFFSVYQFTEFVFISIIWLTLLGRKELLILRSLVNSIVIVIFLLVFAFIC